MGVREVSCVSLVSTDVKQSENAPDMIRRSWSLGGDIVSPSCPIHMSCLRSLILFIKGV